MQQKTIWCAGILLTGITMLMPQPSFSLPALQPVPAAQPIATPIEPVRLEIRLSQRRVNVYQGEHKVKSYSIAVGRPGWETPVGTYTVRQKIRNPAWVHPLKSGETIPGGDPENPLGRFWIGFWTDGKNWIGFHGTPNPESVGTAASHGCIRMYNRDVEELFTKVSLGTEVIVRK
ncbi:MAG TPA: L,D-transpeptidase [Leptolyngbya sp.]|jgi:lipoprotein-anchoring transpeptidase ErfK/SrfK|nr:L,D-transpeptidase [Leptolyngbya sp.]